jgi:hypothetical protein
MRSAVGARIAAGPQRPVRRPDRLGMADILRRLWDLAHVEAALVERGDRRGGNPSSTRTTAGGSPGSRPPTTQRGAATADCGSSPARIPSSTCARTWACAVPPIVPNTPASSPSRSTTSAMSVWEGRRALASSRGDRAPARPGSRSFHGTAIARPHVRLRSSGSACAPAMAGRCARARREYDPPASPDEQASSRRRSDRGEDDVANEGTRGARGEGVERRGPTGPRRRRPRAGRAGPRGWRRRGAGAGRSWRARSQRPRARPRPGMPGGSRR